MKQRLLLTALALGLCSISVFAQKRELQVEKDGFRWYKVVKDFYHQGAQSIDGKMIIPSNYYLVIYQEGSDGWFEVIDNDNNKGAWDKNGRCIIPTSRRYSGVCKYKDSYNYCYTIEKNNKYGACDENGKEIIAATYDFLLYSSSDHVFKYRNSNGDHISTGISINGYSNDSSSSSSSSGSIYDFIFDLYSKKSVNADFNPIPKMPKNEGGSFNEYIVRIELNASAIDYKILIVDRKNNDKTTILESYSIRPSSGFFAILSDGIQFCEYDNGKPRGILIRNDVTTVGKWDGTTFDEGWYFPQFNFYSNVGGTLGNTIAMYKGLIEGFNKNTNFSHTQAGETDFQGKYTKLKDALHKYNWKKVVRE